MVKSRSLTGISNWCACSSPFVNAWPAGCRTALFFGSTILTGKPAHVDAMAKFATALLKAEGVTMTSASD